MTVLSVGLGSTIVVELPDGRTVLCDCGGALSYDPGERTILPLLAARRIGRIHSAFVSHPNLDHYSGLPAVASRRRVERVVVSPHFMAMCRDSDPCQVLLEELAKGQVPMEESAAAPASYAFGDVRFELLWPPADRPFDWEPNESSQVIRIEYGKHRILITGDIEQQAIAALLNSNQDLRADVLLLPHHGSVTRPLRAFVDAVDPKHIIRSAALRNAESPRLRDVLGRHAVWNTADVGAVTVKLTPETINIYGNTPNLAE
jgi:competence protein ComEC